MLHDNCSGGQLGTERTLEKARARFYWPFMLSDVELHCKSCDLCSARRKPARRPEHQCKFDRRLQNIPRARYWYSV